jgi:hypothetical protein
MRDEYEEHLTPAERELGHALGSLRPASTGLSASRVTAAAHLERARRTLRAWQALAAALAVITTVATAAAIRTPRIVERIVLRDPPAVAVPAAVETAHASPAAPSQPMAYLRLRALVIADGPAVLESPTANGAGRGQPIRVRQADRTEF